ncbi:MAG: TadE/TadG family type IV pilus assembly protein [Pseudomonadota bacterium]
MGWRQWVQYPKIVRRFQKSDDGVTAVEFAIVGGPFFLLLFAIIESSLFFFAGQYLESTVDDVTRLFRTGQFNTETTEQEFRDEFCSRLVVMFTCADVRTEIQAVADFDDLTDPEEPDDEGELGDSSFTATDALQVIQVSAQYKWPVFTNYAAPLVDTPDGNFALIQVVSVTRAEPYK